MTSFCILALFYVHFDFSYAGLRDLCFISDSIDFPLDTFATYIPVFLIIVLNWRILLESRKQRKKILALTLPAPDNDISEDLLKEKIRMRVVVRFFVDFKAAKTFFVVVAVLIFCLFTPTLIGDMLQHFCSTVCSRYFTVIFRYEFYGINSIVNAFVYGMRHVKYRKAFVKLLLKVTSNFKVRN